MKKLLFGAIALTLMASACKKDDNGTPSNTYSVNGTSYTLIANGFSVNNGLIGISGINGTTGGSLIFTFNKTPTANGTYKVVDFNAASQADAEVSFAASTLTGSTPSEFESTGAGAVSATVTVNGGKITISMPDAPAKQTVGGTATVNVNCNVTQP